MDIESLERALKGVATVEAVATAYSLSSQINEVEFRINGGKSVHIKYDSRHNIEAYLKKDNDICLITDCDSVSIIRSEIMDKRVQQNAKYSLMLNEELFGKIRQIQDKRGRQIENINDILGNQESVSETYFLKPVFPKLRITGVKSNGTAFDYEIMPGKCLNRIIKDAETSRQLKAESIDFLIIKTAKESLCEMKIIKSLGKKGFEYFVDSIEVIHG